MEVGSVSLGGGAGGGPQKESERRTRCTRGSASEMPLLLLLSMEMEAEERDEVVRRRARGWDESEERLVRVEELGVDGLMREGRSLSRGGEVSLRCRGERVRE